MDLRNIAQLQRDDEKNRKIFTRARKNLIRTQIQQEVTCYDLQSQIQILEETNKKKTEKMIIIQKECVILSERLDDEIRHRPEIIKNVKNTTVMTDFLKKMIIELNETLFRCQSDKKALSLAIEKCTQEGKAIKEEFKKQEQQTENTISILEEKLQNQTESDKKMLEGLNSHKSILEGELKECRKTLLKYENTNMDLNKQNDEFKIQLTHNTQEFEKISVAFKNKEKELEDSKKIIDNLFTDTRMKTNMLEDLSKSKEKLKSKLKNKKAITAGLLEQKNELSGTLLEMKGQHLTLTEQLNSLKSARDDAIAATENFKVTVAQLEEDKKELEKDVIAVTENFKVTVAQLEEYKKKLEKDVIAATKNFKVTDAQLEEDIKQLEKDGIAVTENFKVTVAQLEEDKKQLEKTICEKNGEILNLKKECENKDQLVVEMKEVQIDLEKKNTLLVDSKQAIDGKIEELAKKNEKYEMERLAYEEFQNTLLNTNEEKTATIESLQAELKRVRDELTNFKMDHERAQASPRFTRAELYKKLNFDVTVGERREEEPMAMEDPNQQGEQLFPPQSSSSLLTYDDKYKYVSDESDDQDEYQPPPPKRNRLNTK